MGRVSAAAASALLTYGAAWKRLIDYWFIVSLPIARAGAGGNLGVPLRFVNIHRALRGGLLRTKQ